MFTPEEKRWFTLLDMAAGDRNKAAALVASDAQLLDQRDAAGETVLHYLAIPPKTSWPQSGSCSNKGLTSMRATILETLP